MLVHWAVLIILGAAIVAISAVVVKAMGLQVPSWIITVLWIVLAAAVGIAAIKFVAGI